MNRSLVWKVALIFALLVVFVFEIIPTKSEPEPIKRGLDLKGGIFLVMRVNVGDAVRLETDQAMEALKAQSKKSNLPTPITRRTDDATFVAAPPAGVSTAEYEKLAKDFLPSFEMSKTSDGALQFRMKPASISALERDTIAQATVWTPSASPSRSSHRRVATASSSSSPASTTRRA